MIFIFLLLNVLCMANLDMIYSFAGIACIVEKVERGTCVVVEKNMKKNFSVFFVWLLFSFF